MAANTWRRVWHIGCDAPVIMGDRELIQVAAFRLHESAERLRVHANAARLAQLRSRLATLAAVLIGRAHELHLLGGNGNGDGPAQLPRLLTEPAELLRRVYQLTQAEARVALLVAAGQSVAQIAAATGVARQTVRNQLKAVFAKTGTMRQAELVRLVLMEASARKQRRAIAQRKTPA